MDDDKLFKRGHIEGKNCKWCPWSKNIRYIVIFVEFYYFQNYASAFFVKGYYTPDVRYTDADVKSWNVS